MKPGIIVMSELRGPLAARVLEVQRRFDPRMAAELPPHITITGSSGMGPILPATTDAEVREALERVAAQISDGATRSGRRREERRRQYGRRLESTWR